MHDLLLALQPPGQEHLACKYCRADEEKTVPETYTEDQVKAAVQDAVAALSKTHNDELAALRADLDKTATDKALADAVAEATAPLTAKVTELEAALETAAIALKASQDEHAAVVAWLDAEAATLTAAATLQARIDKVKAADVFTDEFVTENSSKWAELTDAAFEDRLVEWTATKAAKGAPVIDPTKTGLPKATAMSDTAAGDAGQVSPTKKVMDLIRQGHNVAAISG